MRVAIVAAMVMALSVSGAMAADVAPLAANTTNNAPLAPAKPAGVAKAQFVDSATLVVVGIGAAIAILGIALSNSSQSQNFATPATTGTQ